MTRTGSELVADGNGTATSGDCSETGPGAPSRRARIRSEVATPGTVAAAIAPDDTADIDTRVEDGAVVTTIERSTTASLEATIDDYVVALGVATGVARTASGVETGGSADGDGGGGDGDERTDNRHADTH